MVIVKTKSNCVGYELNPTKEYFVKEKLTGREIGLKFIGKDYKKYKEKIDLSNHQIILCREKKKNTKKTLIRIPIKGKTNIYNLIKRI